MKFMYKEYRDIYDMDTEKIYVLMMTTYNKYNYFTMIINQIDKYHKFALEGGQDMSEAMIIYKGVTLITNITMFHHYIQER